LPSGSAPAGDWRLASEVHGVAIGQDLVLLDVQADAYFCLVDAASSVAVGPDGEVRIAEPAVRETLIEAGLITPGARRPQRNITPAQRDVGPAAPARLDAKTAGRLLRATWIARRHLSSRSFAQLLGWAAARPGDQSDPEPTDALIAEATRFAAVRVWAPFDGACLARSYMALQYLRLCGHDASWVIGVRTWPFSAHCWLQAGDIVLDDTAARVLPYRPILVV
jgi:hypothetical protein